MGYWRRYFHSATLRGHLELLMLKKNKVVDLDKERKKRESPKSSRTSLLATEMNQALRGTDWLDNLRAAGL